MYSIFGSYKHRFTASQSTVVDVTAPEPTALELPAGLQILLGLPSSAIGVTPTSITALRAENVALLAKMEKLPQMHVTGAAGMAAKGAVNSALESAASEEEAVTAGTASLVEPVVDAKNFMSQLGSKCSDVAGPEKAELRANAEALPQVRAAGSTGYIAQGTRDSSECVASKEAAVDADAPSLVESADDQAVATANSLTQLGSKCSDVAEPAKAKHCANVEELLQERAAGSSENAALGTADSSDADEPVRMEISARTLSSLKKELKESHDCQELMKAEISDLKQARDGLHQELFDVRWAYLKLVAAKQEAKSDRDAKIKSLEAELSELRLIHARIQRVKQEGEIPQPADGRALLCSLRAPVTKHSESNAALVRKVSAHAAAAAGAAKHVEVLEGECARLAAAVAEARSQQEIPAAKAEAAGRALREELNSALERADRLATQVDGLTDAVETLRSERDQSRASALEEVRRMKGAMTARIEAANVAEARVEELKRLLNDDHLAAVEGRQKLDGAADALRRDKEVTEATLDQKLADIAEQRCQLEHARVDQVKQAAKIHMLQGEASNARLERDCAVRERGGLVHAALQARTERDEAIAQHGAAIATVASLKKKVCELEQRMILGDGRELSMRTPGSTYADPTGGVRDSDDDPEALSVIKRIQQKHEAVVAPLRERDTHASN